MSRVTPQEFQAKHAANLKNSVTYIRSGIAKVTDSPMAAAVAKQDKMLTKLTAAVQGGAWAAGLNKVTLQQWKDQTTNVGVNRIAAGIDAAAPKVIAFATQLLPAVDAAVAKIKSMPDTTLEDNINRVSVYLRQMGTFKKT